MATTYGGNASGPKANIMTHLTTYSDASMSIAAKICAESAKRNGIDKVWSWTDAAIRQTEFYEQNKAILDQPRGNGYWCWKPFVILDTMQRVKEGDIVVYADAGIEFIAPIKHIIDRMDKDIFLFANQYKHVEWSKGDLLDLIIPEWRDGRYDNFNQVQASVIFTRNTEYTRAYVKEWLSYCCIPSIIDDSPSKSPNYKNFSENRHDQSCLCSLQIKHGLQLHYWAASYNNGAFNYPRGIYSDSYPVPMFNHHRKRNNEW